jgi:hypothetical protein
MAVRRHLNTQGLIPNSCIAACRFTPAASTAAIVTSEKWGIDTITRDSTGVYTIKLFGKVKGMIALAVGQENDTTTYHDVRVESQSDTAGTVTISHKSVLFASVATGPAVSDTIDSICVFIYGRAG